MPSSKHPSNATRSTTNAYMQFCASYRASPAWTKSGNSRLSVPQQGALLGRLYRQNQPSYRGSQGVLDKMDRLVREDGLDTTMKAVVGYTWHVSLPNKRKVYLRYMGQSKFNIDGTEYDLDAAKAHIQEIMDS